MWGIVKAVESFNVDPGLFNINKSCELVKKNDFEILDMQMKDVCRNFTMKDTPAELSH